MLELFSLFNTAANVIGAFKGSSQLAKATGYFQDAVSVVTALTPLVQQFGRGEEVTPDEVRAALAGKDTALKELDDLIAAKSKE